MLESPRVKLAGDISLLGTLAMIGGLAAAAMAIWMGVCVLTRKRFTLPEKFIRIGFDWPTETELRRGLAGISGAMRAELSAG